MEQVDAYYRFLNKLSASWQGLTDKPEETPDTTLRALWYLASGDRRSVKRSIFDSLPYLSDDELEQLDDYVEIRLTGTPLAHITKRQMFMGVEMLAGPGALIPRKETETLGNAALAILQDIIQERGSAKVIDLCTGCGNLALALAHHQPECTVCGSDISEEAISLARQNAQFLGLEERVNFIAGDLFEPFENEEFYGNVDLLVCNPPYISSARVDEMADEIAGHEPREAFDGGPFGVSVIMALIKEGPKFLKPGAWLGFEVGLGQGKAMGKRMRRSGGFDQIEEYCDAEGNIRSIFGKFIDKSLR